jgi:hypothetical protein
MVAKYFGPKRPAGFHKGEDINYYVPCLNCGTFVHWSTTVCEKCLADPMIKKDSEPCKDLARHFPKEMGDPPHGSEENPETQASEGDHVR